MVQKRPFGDGELYEISSKQPRKLECSDSVVSSLEFIPSLDAADKASPLGEGVGSFGKNETEIDEKLINGLITELSEKDVESSAPGCVSHSSWATSTTSEEDVRSEAPFHLSSSPEYHTERPMRILIHSENVYSSLLEYPPRKLVSIGPDYQAEIPEWRQRGTKNSATCPHLSEASTFFNQTSGSDINGGNNDENKLAGICVIPPPELEPLAPLAYSGDNAGDGRDDCCCQDIGSIRCVRQHIMEAREKLGRALGQERFEKLGFSDMGEVVAERWSEEEEHMFHEVVFSNPASLGKNFWDHLSMAFPYRTKSDIVSYYFNVFMLQRRAEQNRCDLLIDSDNDEWQGSEDSGDDETGTVEEDEYSAVESPVYHDDPGHIAIQGDNSLAYKVGVTQATCESYDQHLSTDKGIADMSEIYPEKLIHNCSSVPTSQLPGGKVIWDERGREHDVHTDLSTSSDTGATLQGAQSKAHGGKSWPEVFNGVSGGGGHEHVLEHCDPKVWDLGYLVRPKDEIDFLPTGSMIEEVFGIGALNCKARDGKSLS